MTYIDDITPEPHSRLETAMNWYLRLLAFCFIGFTVMYWLRVSGFYDGANWRFDTMTNSWKIASALLSVLMPVAAVGLWSTLSWGQVVWAMAIFVELMMHTWFNSRFGTHPDIVWFHLASIAVYLFLRGGLIYKAKKA